MSIYTLESLPADIIVTILSSFTSFSDLRELTISSPVYYRYFGAYTNTVLKSVAKGIVGDAWDEAREVLIYTRNLPSNPKQFPNYAIIQKELSSWFIFRKSDVAKFLENQKFFNFCYNSLLNPTDLTRSQLERFDPPPIVSPSDPPVLAPGAILPISTFYKLWLLNLRFRYDTIETFAAREMPPPGLILDFKVICRLICLTTIRFGSPERVCYAPEWEAVLYTYSHNSYLLDLIEVWGWNHRDIYASIPFNEANLPDEPLIKIKMKAHISAAYFAQPALYSFPAHEDLQRLVASFEIDYQESSTEELVSKYGLWKCLDKGFIDSSGY